jgi:hypothetical protein
MKKRLLIENDIDELEDFRKILLLNKNKLDYRDVDVSMMNMEMTSMGYY